MADPADNPDDIKRIAAALALQKRKEEAALAARRKQLAELPSDSDESDDSEGISRSARYPLLHLCVDRSALSPTQWRSEEDPPMKLNQYVLRATLGAVSARIRAS